MSVADIREFVIHWHEAMRSSTTDSDEHAQLMEYQHKLIERITSRRHLKALAETPLLCALLCALHRDRRGQLPSNRMELYDVALEMLLERRDAEHHVAADTMLSRTEKTILLQDIAYWLIRNGWSDAEKINVINRIKVKLAHMSQISAPADTVYQSLLERSGLIREPIAGRVDFVHRTFQEYLAAIDALAADDIGLLVKNAHLDQWREVVIMAAGRAFPNKREELLGALVARGDLDKEHRDEIYLLAVACLETSPELPPDLREQIRVRAKDLIPPKNMTTAKSLASAGEFVVDLLAQSRPRLAIEVASTIRAAAEIGTDSALRVIISHRNDSRVTVFKQLVQAWTHFDVEEYAQQVLAHTQHPEIELRAGSRDLLSGLRFLPHLKSLQLSAREAIDLEFLINHRNLASLTVRDSRLENPRALGYCIGLERLVLMGTDITDISPLVSMADLETLYLTHSQVDDLMPLAQLKNLKSLGLYSSDRVTDISPISGVRTLEMLDLEGTAVSDISALAGMRSMRQLDIRGLKIADLNPLMNMLELFSFHAEQTLVEDLTPLSSSIKLKYLYLAKTMVSSLEPLREMVAISRLDLRDSSYQIYRHFKKWLK